MKCALQRAVAGTGVLCLAASGEQRRRQHRSVGEAHGVSAACALLRSEGVAVLVPSSRPAADPSMVLSEAEVDRFIEVLHQVRKLFA